MENIDISPKEEIQSVYDQLSSTVNSECFGADWRKYSPNVSQFENLSNRFYQIVDNITDDIEFDIKILNKIRDAKAALNREFMSFNSESGENPYPLFKRVFSEIYDTYNEIAKVINNKGS